MSFSLPVDLVLICHILNLVQILSSKFQQKTFFNKARQNSRIELILKIMFRAYGNPHSPTETIHHLAPVGPKTKGRASDRKFVETGHSSEVHCYQSVYEEQSSIHPPLTDNEIRRQNYDLWHKVREKRKLNQLDNFREFCKKKFLKCF